MASGSTRRVPRIWMSMTSPKGRGGGASGVGGSSAHTGTDRVSAHTTNQNIDARAVVLSLSRSSLFRTAETIVVLGGYVCTDSDRVALVRSLWIHRLLALHRGTKPILAQ